MFFCVRNHQYSHNPWQVTSNAENKEVVPLATVTLTVNQVSFSIYFNCY